MSSAPPPGLRKDAPISVDTPVIKWPFDATAKDPRVSVKVRIRPPWRDFPSKMGLLLEDRVGERLQYLSAVHCAKM
jgi:hypothetical protein